MIRRPIDWDACLGEFHSAFPGITEDVLARCSAGQLSPYGWLTEGLDHQARVLDLGCGSGPARSAGATHWVGVDRSPRELERAVELGRDRVLRGDITQLPIGDRSIDVVTSSMAMMLVHPIDVALGEIRRVLRDAGELRLLLPARSPLTALDRFTYLRLFWAARSTTKFPPTTMRATAKPTLESSGFTVLFDDRVRFDLPVDDAADADRFINSWYLPSTTDERRASARQQARSMAPFRIGVPLRRIVARRS
ncbi:MAG: class I SAM-dependent methyltransferase [Aquihabitans sp.]